MTIQTSRGALEITEDQVGSVVDSLAARVREAFFGGDSREAINPDSDFYDPDLEYDYNLLLSISKDYADVVEG